MKPLLKSVFLFLAALSLASLSFAADASSLKPPPGAKVAIVMFEDLECPDCARAYPVVWDAAKAHNIPVMLRDFPLPKHNWSFDAAVYARYFDAKSKKMGEDFRGFIFQSQPNITRENLRQYVQKFADDNKVPLPFNIDPEGKLKAKVLADYALGQKINIQHTPTIFVIGRDVASGPPFVEVVDPAKLTEQIEDMQRKAGPATAAPVKRASAKGRKK